jgi:hypothetical protein
MQHLQSPFWVNSIVDNALKKLLSINPSLSSHLSSLTAGTQIDPFTRLLQQSLFNFGGQYSEGSNKLNDKYCLITNELIRLFMNQASLKVLTYYNHYSYS